MSEKLVRDFIPEIALRNGDDLRFRVAEKGEMIELLCAKLVEEAGELAESWSAEELADVLEVVNTLVKLTNGSSLRAVQRRKRQERGGFDRRLVLIQDDA